MVHPEVTIEQGTLRGTISKDYLGNSFFKFRGIPYARPPLGDLRFKAPQPPEKWTGILDATKEGDPCFARDPIKNNQLFGSENCLSLNVFTKKFDESEDLHPVLFWIHGGGFVFGSGSEELYGPDFLMTENVVVVTINYRLGILGFISFEDPTLDIPGNAGLKDQVMALQWVQKNISKFGGDPNNVTIFGESAGGASVHLLMLSPMGKGLFHKAIAQSGCALNPWVNGVRGTKVLEKAMDLEDADEKTIFNTLMEKTVEEIFQIQEKMGDDGAPHKRRPLGLVIEKNAKNPFLDDEPIRIMRSGNFNQVPFMIGFTSSEGMILELYRKSDEPEMPNFENVIPWFFGCESGKPETQDLANKIKKFYFGDNEEEYSQKLATKKYDMFSDSQFICGIYDTVKNHLHHSKTPIYLYRISVESELNFLKKFMKIEVPGVSHCDDVGYLFKNLFTPEIKSGSIEDISVRRFVKLWTNFAKFGNPTPAKSGNVLSETIWRAVTETNLHFLDIGKDLAPMENPNLERINFWKNLFAQNLETYLINL